MSLWVPPAVSRELVDKRHEFNAQVLSLLYLEGGVLDEWNRELKNIDPLLRLGQAVNTIPFGVPLEPGFYHLVRLNTDAPISVTPLRGPDGGFAVPTSRMLENLKAADLQSAVVQRALRAREEAAKAEQEKKTALLREERQEELRGRVDAAFRTQVLTSPDVPWSQNASGRRGAKRRGDD